MILSILQNTPSWVWPLLALLLFAGWQQMRPRQVSLLRITILPLVLLGLSLSGVLTTFGASAVAMMAWLGGFAAVLVVDRPWMLRARDAAWAYDRDTRLVHVPGSMLPLLLILCIFSLKYAVGVSLAMQPALRASLTFALVVSALYGAFSAAFAARTVRGLMLAKVAPSPTLTPHRACSHAAHTASGSPP